MRDVKQTASAAASSEQMRGHRNYGLAYLELYGCERSLGVHLPSPCIPCLELQSKTVVTHAQIAIGATCHRGRDNPFDFLGHHPDVKLITPHVAKTVHANPVVETFKPGNVPFKTTIR